MLLESGGLDYEADTAALNTGPSVGRPYYDLEDSRLRLFGGTAAIWGGRCAELDDIDFEPREWVRYSGWPFRKQTLQPYYKDAKRLLQLDEKPEQEDPWNAVGLQTPRFGSGVLAADFWQFDDGWDRFGASANRDLLHHPNLHIYIHATAVELHLNAFGTAIESAEVASLSGKRERIRAGTFILAAGGIENARILLASRSRQANGIGNSQDVVGRYFMEHPHARGGELHVRQLWSTLQTFRSSHWSARARYAACLRPSDELQRQHQILNSSFTPRVRPHADAKQAVGNRLYQAIKEHTTPTRSKRAVWRATRSTKLWWKRITHPLKPWALLRFGNQGLYLSVRAEQAPNPSSRVRLVEQRDALGMPRIALDWQLSEIDKRTISVMMQALDARMRQEGSGHVIPAKWLQDPELPWEHDELISLHAFGGYHHMGTTRMASDPRFGVVDANCRVHGIANLFIAGSSVFPTAGWANPTLTILALALRLGDHVLSLGETATGASLAIRDRLRSRPAQTQTDSQTAPV